MITLISLLVLLVNIGLLIGVGIRWSKDGPTGIRPAMLGVNGVMLILNLVLVQGLVQVDSGSRGVVIQVGAVTNRILEPGLSFKVPFVQSVASMDVQTRAYEAESAAASKDLQDVKTHVTANYALNPSKVGQIFQDLRRDYLNRILKPAIQESVKAATAQFNAEELITQRPHVRNEIERILQVRLGQFGIDLKALSITNFEFSSSFSASIEAKVVAVQSALEAENKLRQIEVEARQVETAAKGQANAAIARADGEAIAILTVAKAQADANKTVNTTLTDQIIRYALVQKLGSEIRVILLPIGQDFILGSEVLR